MSENLQTNLSVLNRLAVWSTAVLVIVLSLAAGFLTRTSAVAQSTAPDHGVASGVSGGVEGGISGTLQAVRIGDLVGSSTEATVVKWLKQVGESVGVGEPMLELSIGDRSITLPASASGVLVQAAVTAGQSVPADAVVALIATNLSIKQGASGGVAGGIPGGINGGVITGLAIQENVIERLDQAAETSIEFKNSGKAPLQINDAKVKQVLRENPGDEYLVVPIVTLTNNTDRRIKGLALEFRNGLERRGYYERVSPPIDARGTYTSGRQKRYIVLVGGASAWSIRVAGVLFEDGDTWGIPPPPPPPPPPPATPGTPKPPPPPPPDSSKLIRKSGGVLATSAITKVNPEYPALAKQAGVSGTVVVEITVDETGNVISASAVSGHPLLKAAAVDAARQWQFTPTTLSGEPVKVVGMLTFNFNL